MKRDFSRLELFCTTLLGLFCVYTLVSTLSVIWEFTTDDAYISWVYARQVAEGKGFLWPGDQHVVALVEGYSNFLWVLFAVVLLQLQLPVITSLKIFSCVCLIGGLGCLYRVGRTFVSPLLAILPVVIVSYFVGLLWWTVSGMESVFYAALSVLLVWFCLLAFGYSAKHDASQNPRTWAWALASVTLLLLSLTRFEGPTWVVPVFCFVLCQRRSLTSSQRVRWGLITLGCFVLPYLLYFIWRYHYFGHWLPNSYQCKSIATGQLFVVDWEYVCVIFPFLVAALPYLLAKKDCRHWLLWLPSLLYLAMLWQAHPVITYYLRLFLGPFCLAAMLPVLGVNQLLRYFPLSAWGNKIITVFVILLLTYYFIPHKGEQGLADLVSHYAERTQNRIQIATMLNSQAASNASVLISDCGIIPYLGRADLRFIDLQCLNNAELTQQPYRTNRGLYADYLNAQVKPDWVISNYYPLESQGDLLIDLLQERGFFKDYRLVNTLKSGGYFSEDVRDREKVIDYVYRVYKRKA